MELRRLAGLMFAATLALGCAGPPAGDESPGADLQTLRAREVTLPSPVRFEAPDRSFRAEAAGRPEGALRKTDVAWLGTFDIGTEQPIGCLFFWEEKDVAGSLASLVDASIEEIARTRELGAREVLAIDAGAVGPTPYLAIDWLVVFDSLVHQVKFKFANKGDRAIYCAHAETGYEEAFESFFRGLVGSYAGGVVKPVRYREVSLLSIGELSIGFQTLSISRDADGDFEAIATGSSLMPSAAGTVVPSDDMDLEWSRPDGSLINQVSFSSDGRSVTRLGLEPVERGTAWRVHGEVKGRRLDTTFESGMPLLSTRGVSQLMLRLGRGEVDGEVEYLRWLGPVDPTAATLCRARQIGARRVASEAGPLAMELELDERGVARGALEMGPLEMTLERVYVEGAL